MAKRKSYDDKFRASAVVMLEAAGYPKQKGALTRVAAHIGVPHPTLSRWYNAKRNPPPNELVQEKRLELSDLLDKAIRDAVATLPNKILDASYRDVSTAIGIFTDKKQLVDGKATERVDHTGFTDEDRAARLAELLERGRTRRTRQPDSGFVQ